MLAYIWYKKVIMQCNMPDRLCVCVVFKAQNKILKNHKNCASFLLTAMLAIIFSEICSVKIIFSTKKSK